jgi:hypothetical protein
MGFLNNSGDIILDAVLTDTGRRLLAKGDGSFNITGFSLADDEIDYSLYKSTNAPGLEDIDIRKTPILEANTNSSTAIKYRLMTLLNTEFVYLPVIRLAKSLSTQGGDFNSNGYFVVSVNEETSDQLVTDGQDKNPGVILGHSLSSAANSLIELHQGIETDMGDPNNLSAALTDTDFSVFVDSKFVNGLPSGQGMAGEIQNVNADGIGKITFTQTGAGHVQSLSPTDKSPVIKGPPGRRIIFTVTPSINLSAGSNFYFTQLGSTQAIGATTYYTLDTNVKIVGMKTGYQITIPIRFIRKQ